MAKSNESVEFDIRNSELIWNIILLISWQIQAQRWCRILMFYCMIQRIQRIFLHCMEPEALSLFATVPLDPSLIQLNQVHALLYYFFNIHF
jgi:hypothetical protein